MAMNEPPLDRGEVFKLVEAVCGEDMHPKRVLSVTNAVLGVVHAAALSIRVTDMRSGEAETVAIVLVVAERLLDGEAFTVEIHEFRAAQVRPTRRRTPSVLHPTRFQAHDSAHLITRSRVSRVLEMLDSPIRRNPRAGGARLTVRFLDADDRAEANHEVEAELSEDFYGMGRRITSVRRSLGYPSPCAIKYSAASRFRSPARLDPKEARPPRDLLD